MGRSRPGALSVDRSGSASKMAGMALIDEVRHAIRHVRERRGLSQEEVSRRSGHHGNYLSKLETGNANPTLKSLQGILEVLDIDLRELAEVAARFAPEPVRGPGTGPSEEVHRYLENLPNSIREHSFATDRHIVVVIPKPSGPTGSE